MQPLLITALECQPLEKDATIFSPPARGLKAPCVPGPLQRAPGQGDGTTVPVEDDGTSGSHHSSCLQLYL
jgi:hypothetical protein